MIASLEERDLKDLDRVLQKMCLWVADQDNFNLKRKDKVESDDFPI